MGAIKSLKRNDIQALRAVAVIVVIAFHLAPQNISGGFTGVDIFFVISGFLITKLILRQLDHNEFSIAGFFEHRIRRIFPALFVVIVFSLCAGYFWETPAEYSELGASVQQASLFVSNNLSTDYFAEKAEFNPLLHTWSLSVEEQFYIVWPLILYGTSRFLRKYLPFIIVVMLLISLCWSQWQVLADQSAAFHSSTARIFEFLMGAILTTNLVAIARIRTTQLVLTGFGIALIALSIIIYSSATPMPGLLALAPCLGAGLIIHSGQDLDSVGQKWRAYPWLVLVGDMSYSLYLWHWPVLVFARRYVGDELTVVHFVIVIVTTFIASYLSYRFVETPFLQKPYRRHQTLIAGILMVALFASTGAAISMLNGLPGRFSSQVLAVFAASGDINPRRKGCHNSGLPIRKFSENCIFGSPDAKPDVAVWGDSHGAELAVALGEYAQKKQRSVMEITSSSCPPAQGFVIPTRRWCPSQNSATLNSLINDVAIKTVILTANAIRYEDRTGLEKGLEETIQMLVAANKRIIVFKQIPIMAIDPPSRIGLVMANGSSATEIGLDISKFAEVTATWNMFLQTIALKHKLELYDPSTQLCSDGVCHEYDDHAGVLYFSRDHLSVAGAKYVSQKLATQLYGPCLRCDDKQLQSLCYLC